LYFPYIDVPRSAWFSRVLLYWDTVASIVPLDYARAPEHHAPYMRDLVAAQLVTQLFPGGYIYQIPDFASPFIEYVQRRLEYAARRAHAVRSDPVMVHAEKTGDIGRELVRLGIAREAAYPWYEMERWTAKAFMTYLATALGALDAVDAAPVTQDRGCLQLLSGPLISDRAMHVGYRALAPARRAARAVILREIFPEPRLPANVRDLADFKERHGDKLRRLRNAVEEKCIEIAKEPDHEVRHERARQIRAQLHDEVAEATEAVRITWGQVIMGGICSVLGAAGVVAGPANQPVAYGAGLVGLAGATYTALEPLRRRNEALKRPLAYAALGNIRFGPR
jgi:hypothetical protein